MPDNVRTWLVEWTCSGDEQDIITLVYTTPDGARYHRKECSLASFESDIRDTYAAVDVLGDKLGRVTDEETRKSYTVATTEMAESHEPTDTV